VCRSRAERRSHISRGGRPCRPQNLLCACDMVSPEFCAPLGTVLCESSSPTVRPSSRLGPKSVSHTLCHVHIHPMLIPIYNPRLSPHRTRCSSHFLQLPSRSFSPRITHCPLVVFRAHLSAFSPFTSLFGRGSAASPFHHTYIKSLCITNAMERVLYYYCPIRRVATLLPGVIQ